MILPRIAGEGLLVMVGATFMVSCCFPNEQNYSDDNYPSNVCQMMIMHYMVGHLPQDPGTASYLSNDNFEQDYNDKLVNIAII